MNSAAFVTQFFQLPNTQRRLAYSAVGDRHSPDVLLCLPGLLETRTSFYPVLQAAQSLSGLRMVALDLCGRGDADPLPNDQGYAMSVYLSDVHQFIQQALMQGATQPRLHLLGTSMGGILSMYVVSDNPTQVHSLTLNDIGLRLKWLSIYGLYDDMKQAGQWPSPEALAAQLQVSVGAVMAVQSPAHFDLPYRKDWVGMQFGHLLQHFQGRMRLVHGSDSGVCLPEQVKEMQHTLPQAQVYEVAHAKHPAPFNPAVCDFVLQGLGEVRAVNTAEEAPPAPLVTPAPPAPPVQPMQPTPPMQPQANLPPTPPDGSPTWWRKIMRRLNATRK